MAWPASEAVAVSSLTQAQITSLGPALCLLQGTPSFWRLAEQPLCVPGTPALEGCWEASKSKADFGRLHGGRLVDRSHQF